MMIIMIFISENSRISYDCDKNRNKLFHFIGGCGIFSNVDCKVPSRTRNYISTGKPWTVNGWRASSVNYGRMRRSAVIPACYVWYGGHMAQYSCRLVWPFLLRKRFASKYLAQVCDNSLISYLFADPLCPYFLGASSAILQQIRIR